MSAAAELAPPEDEGAKLDDDAANELSSMDVKSLDVDCSSSLVLLPQNGMLF